MTGYERHFVLLRLVPLFVDSGLLGQERGLDVGQDAALDDGDTGQEAIELFVLSDGQLQVTGDDAGLLVGVGGVAGQLQHLGGQVLQHGGQVDGARELTRSE